jgi:hypothetical protein
MYSVHYEKSREHTVPLLGKFAGRDKHGLGPGSGPVSCGFLLKFL